MLFAFTMDYHVIQAYQFLVSVYKPGDKIYMFGFSRGSLIARILAGMIQKIGLLDNATDSMVSTAWEIYKEWEMNGQPSDYEYPQKCQFSIKNFKQTFCKDFVDIEFLGLFDTVNSSGMFNDRLFPYTSNTKNVKHLRHAVSIGERRSKFKQNLFLPFDPLNDQSGSGGVGIFSNDLIEAWFPGDHSDLGGNRKPDIFGDLLGNVPFRWILSFAIEFGVLFKSNSLLEFQEKFPSLYSALSYEHDALSFQNKEHLTKINPFCTDNNDYFPNSEEPRIPLSNLKNEKLDRFGGFSTENKFMKYLWWLIEILPIGYQVESKKCKWKTVYYPNLGSKRDIPENAKIHWSVLWRIKFVRQREGDWENLPVVYDVLKRMVLLDDLKNGESVNVEANSDNKTIVTNKSLINYKTGLINTKKLNEYAILLDADKIDLRIDWFDPPHKMLSSGSIANM